MYKTSCCVLLSSCVAIYLLVFSTFLNGCAVAAKPTPTPVEKRDIDRYLEYYTWADYEENDMKYRIYFYWRNGYQTSQSGAAVHVVNMTKEKLEVELLKKQLGSQVQKGVLE